MLVQDLATDWPGNQPLAARCRSGFTGPDTARGGYHRRARVCAGQNRAPVSWIQGARKPVMTSVIPGAAIDAESDAVVNEAFTSYASGYV